MKFLIIVLAAHFIAEMVGNKRKEKNGNDVGAENRNVFHPAEFNVR